MLNFPVPSAKVNCGVIYTGRATILLGASVCVCVYVCVWVGGCTCMYEGDYAQEKIQLTVVLQSGMIVAESVCQEG